MNNNLNEIDNYYKLRDEIQFCVNCIIYIKEKIKNVNELNNQKDKLNDVFNNLEQLCQKEIDLINEGIVCYINNNENNDNNLKNFIINNYKKIIDTFNKIMSINIIKDLYSNYINNNNNDNNESFNVNNNENIENEKNNEKENLNNIINKFKENLIKCNYEPKKENKNDFNFFIKKKFNINNNNNFNYENNLKFIKEIESKIDNIKILKENLQNKINNNCILNNEKKNFEKLKNENLILINEINFIKENLISLENVYKNLVQKLTILEEEQIELLNHNKELISYVKNKYIQNNNNNNSFTNQSNNDNLNNIKLNNNFNNKIINSNNNLEISHLISNPSSIEMMNKINKNIN